MTERFKKFIQTVLFNENGSTACGYVNDPMDNGGETVSGITRKNHPNLKIWEKLDTRTSERGKKVYRPSTEEWDEIHQIYYTNYYKKVNADSFNDEELALHVFDMAVNSGVYNASRMLQRVLGVPTDGMIGQRTLTTANMRKDTLQNFKDERKRYYNELARKKSNQKFLKGWLKRIENCVIENK